ncbi:MAG: TetR/AcrR family transcriptional regulator [Gaiellaceae bacterium]
MTASRGRLPAKERRAGLLETACRCFSHGTYHGTTTADIAAAAGVTEPVLYRHFPSKQQLYLACLDEAWLQARGIWEHAVEAEPDPAEWLSAMGRAFHGSAQQKAMLSNLWLQAIADAAGDAELRHYMQRYVRTIHEYVAAVIRRAQERGGVRTERDPAAEAWLFIATGLLGAVGVRLGGLIDSDLEAIRSARREWLAGS